MEIQHQRLLAQVSLRPVSTPIPREQVLRDLGIYLRALTRNIRGEPVPDRFADLVHRHLDSEESQQSHGE